MSKGKINRREFLNLTATLTLGAMTAVYDLTAPTLVSATGRSVSNFRPLRQIEISAANVNKAVYIAAAVAKENPQLDILVGATYHMLQQQTDLSTLAIQDAIDGLHRDIEGSLPNRDLSPDNLTYMSRILTRLVPTMSEGSAKEGVKDYTRAFLRSYRRPVDEYRQVAPIQAEFDKFSAINHFRYDIWEQFYELVTANQAIATAINQSYITEVLDVQTTDTATTILSATPSEPLAKFIIDHMLPDGSLRVNLIDLEGLVRDSSNRMFEISHQYQENLFELNRVEQAARDTQMREAPPALSGLVDRSIVQRSNGRSESPFAVGATEIQSAFFKEKELSSLTPTATPLPDIPGASEYCQPRKREESLKKYKFLDTLCSVEEKQRKVDGKLSDMRWGVNAAFKVGGFLLRDDKEFLEDFSKYTNIAFKTIDSFQKVSKDSIETARRIGRFLRVGETGFNTLGAIAFTGGLVGIGVAVLGMLNGGGGIQPDPIQQSILDQLKTVTTMITVTQQEMHQRFDRIDRQLNKIYDVMVDEFTRINWELGEIARNIEEIKATLSSLESDLQHLRRNIYDMLDAGFRNPFEEAIDRYLNFYERTRLELDYKTYTDVESLFYSWAFTHSRHELLGGGPTDTRSFKDNDIFTEMNRLPLEANINYLNEILLKRFGLSKLSENRLANPFYWTIGSEVYAQLAEEWPTHASRISSNRVEDLIKIGNELGTSLSKIANVQLFEQLSTHYLNQLNQLKEAIKGLEAGFEEKEQINYRMPSYRLWGSWNDINREPKDHYFMKPQDIRRCDNKPFPSGINVLKLDFKLLAAQFRNLIPYMVADNLGAGKLDACLSAIFKRETKKEDGRTTTIHRLYVTLSILFDGHEIYKNTVPAKGVLGEFENSLSFNTKFSNLTSLPPSDVSVEPRRYAKCCANLKISSGPTDYAIPPEPVEPPDPIETPFPGGDTLPTVEDAYALLVGLWHWPDYPDADEGRYFFSGEEQPIPPVDTPELRARTIVAIEAKLKDLQREFYGEVANMLAGDPPPRINLKGSKLLWQSFIMMGLPLSIERNDALRSLVFGNEAILS